MEKGLTPELKKLKEELDFLHKKLADLDWEIATMYYGEKTILGSEADALYERRENYVANIELVIEQIKQAVTKTNAR